MATAAEAAGVRILGIDPGHTRSAWVLLEGPTVVAHDRQPNVEVLLLLAGLNLPASRLQGVDGVVLEQIEGYGMTVGAEVFGTVFWAGRFYQAVRRGIGRAQLTRRAVKQHICETTKGNDATVRDRLIGRYGGKQAAIGTKAAPGPLWGITADRWAALAVAVTWMDQGGSRRG